MVHPVKQIDASENDEFGVLKDGGQSAFPIHKQTLVLSCHAIYSHENN